MQDNFYKDHISLMNSKINSLIPHELNSSLGHYLEKVKIDRDVNEEEVMLLIDSIALSTKRDRDDEREEEEEEIRDDVVEQFFPIQIGEELERSHEDVDDRHERRVYSFVYLDPVDSRTTYSINSLSLSSRDDGLTYKFRICP